jgi:hypothetical protein
MIALSLKIDTFFSSFSKLSIIYRGPTPYTIVFKKPFHLVGYVGYIWKSEVGMRKSEVEIGKLNSALRGLEG